VIILPYITGFSNPVDLVKDMATALTTNAEESLTLVYPASTGAIVDRAVLQFDTTFDRQWVKKESLTVTAGVIQLSNDIAVKGEVRIQVRDPGNKYFLTFDKTVVTGTPEPEPNEFYIDPADSSILRVNTLLNGKVVFIDFEEVAAVTVPYYVSFFRPANTVDGRVNEYYVEWVIGDALPVAPADGSVDQGFPVDHSSVPARLSWFRETDDAEAVARDWLPIEYHISFDNNGLAGVVIGDENVSKESFLSSPFGFGRLSQLEDALESDISGNFAGYGGSFYEPEIYLPNGDPNPVYKQYGDYTGTGVIDVVVAKSKSGVPFMVHKVSLFGSYEFKEGSFNGQSLHTGKQSVSPIVVGNLHENDRGTLPRAIAAPRTGKAHLTELIAKRYTKYDEERYLFCHINAPYSIFNTSNDVLIGFAIRIDI